jgi:preprotein translocase subunit SecA
LLSRQGIKHDVLNAKQHEREADIVAHAGELGHITVATNMAGRGTDIKLGEGVRELGGLRIIGTERHESRRIDNQLRGRAGRQGDPGSSKFYISLEDDFIFRTQGDRMKKLMQFAGMEPGEVIESSMITSSIERAQRSIEEYNFDVRKQRLRYDDVMNQQRRVIYSYRKEILHDLSSSRSIIKDFIHGAITELASNIVGNLSLSHDHVEMIKQRVAELGNVDIETVFAGFAPHVSTWDALVDQLVEHVLHRYEESSSRINHEIVEQNERWILLETVDFAWRTHLNNLEQIYDGISFRGNAQRDPLIEYKKESFLAFEQMMLEIKYNVLGALIRTQADLSQEALERIERERKAELNALVNSDSSSTDKDSGASSSASHDGGNRKARRARSRRR